MPPESWRAPTDSRRDPTVVTGDVLHVAKILVAALDLERADAGLNQRIDIPRLIVVLHRKEVLFEGDDLAAVILQCIWQATVLRAVAPVGAGVRSLRG